MTKPLLHYVPFAELTRLRTLQAPVLVRATAFAAACRINALYMIARAGSGHIGTSFSCMDIVAWLFLDELRGVDRLEGPRDRYFSSKGHDAPALYAVLIGLGRLPFELLHRLRRLDGLPGHPDVAVPYVETNTGSLGMGVSKAKGMVLANRLLGRREHIYVLTGDGELQEGQFWESLPSAVHQCLGEITVVVDHNRVQSDTWVKDVNDLGDLEAKLRAFGWVVDRCDGHDLEAVAAALGRFREIPDHPKILVADTVKGKGVGFMQPEAMDATERLYRFHSGAPSADVYAKAASELIEGANGLLRRLAFPELALVSVRRPTAVVPANVQRLVGAYSRELVRQAERNSRLVALDADLVLDCGLVPFREKFPERLVECGIAEQDMVSQAGGMALRGLLPVVHSFACFLSTRPNEQIYNNATERTRIIYVASLAGLVPAGPGHSHQSVRDISALAAVPGLVMLEPSCETEVGLALDYCVNVAEESCYLRLVSVSVEVSFALPPDYRMVLGRGVVLREGKDGAFIGYGPVLLGQACHAADLLARRGLDLAVINLPWLNRVDVAWLERIAARYPWIFTLDNHYIAGGQGQMLLAELSALGLVRPPRALRLGVGSVPACGTNAETLQAHRLDAPALGEAVRAAIEDPSRRGQRGAVARRSGPHARS